MCLTIATMMHLSSVMLILSTISFTYASNILAVLPMPSKSHFAVIDPLLITLAEKGHHVTVYNTFPKTYSIPRYKEVDISSCFSFSSEVRPIETMLKLTAYPIQNLVTVFQYTPDFSNIWNCSGLVELLKSEEKYDLFITESFAHDGMLIFAHKFQIPFITYMPNVLFPWLSSRMGEPDNPSYQPHFFLGSTAKMSFWERLHNTVLYVSSFAVYGYYDITIADKLFRDAFGASAPRSSDMVKNTSLLFMYTAPGLMPGVPHVPNVIDIGGTHIKEAKALPKVCWQLENNMYDLHNTECLEILNSVPARRRLQTQMITHYQKTEKNY